MHSLLNIYIIYSSLYICSYPSQCNQSLQMCRLCGLLIMVIGYNYIISGRNYLLQSMRASVTERIFILPVTIVLALAGYILTIYMFGHYIYHILLFIIYFSFLIFVIVYVIIV